MKHTWTNDWKAELCIITNQLAVLILKDKGSPDWSRPYMFSKVVPAKIFESLSKEDAEAVRNIVESLNSPPKYSTATVWPQSEIRVEDETSMETYLREMAERILYNEFKTHILNFTELRVIGIFDQSLTDEEV